VTKVRMFAALRASAGEEWTEVEATDVAAAVAELCERYGEEFRRRLERSKVILNDHQVDPDASQPLEPGDELVLLPPFAGGSEDEGGPAGEGSGGAVCS
jgi:molybdopterin converting factor small subunit